MVLHLIDYVGFFICSLLSQKKKTKKKKKKQLENFADLHLCGELDTVKVRKLLSNAVSKQYVIFELD